MKKAQTLFIGSILVATIAITGGAVWYHNYAGKNAENFVYPTSQYGAFLAAQHAVYVNDSDTVVIKNLGGGRTVN